MQNVTIALLGVLGAVVPSAIFLSARAKPVDVALAAFGYGGLVAVIAGMGPYYSAGPYLFVPLAVLFTIAWMLATMRVIGYRGPVRLRWRQPP
jgi:4-amino-4-deoxy-L-arabinose transferase-like glycosyltransferase